MTQHTPGPWHVTTRGGNAVNCAWAQEITAGRQHTRVGFWVEGPGLGHAADANMRLIAAAPDLLAALRLMVNARTKGFLESWQWEQRINDAVDAARAAIAKAEGGE